MLIKQEQPVLLGQNVWENHSLWGGQQQQQQQFDASIHHVADDSFTVPATARSQLQSHKSLHHQHRRRLKAQHCRFPQLSQLTQQDIIAWAQGLSHPSQVRGCHPHHQQSRQHLTELQHPYLNQFQGQLHQQQSTKMENKHFPYIHGIDDDSWQVGDSYGGAVLSDMSAYSAPGDGVHQTMGGYHVSGREPDASHSQSPHHQQLDQGARGNSTFHHPAWPTFQTTYSDKYSPPPFDSSDAEHPKQQVLPAIFGDPTSSNYLDMHHGLPSNVWATGSTMPLLGEPMLCNGQLSPPNTTYSSFSSTSASDAMASMGLGTPLDTHSVGPADMTLVGLSTISPEVLRINPSPAPTCSSASTHSTSLPKRDGGGLPSAPPSFEQQCPRSVPQKHIDAKGRKALPDKPRAPHYFTTQSDAASSQKYSDKHTATHRSKHLADLKPKPHRTSLPEISSPEDLATVERNKQNEFLIQSKLAGMTYRDIKREGGFREAESTLRGRYRTLTKPKVARVRKPEWTERDLDLLKKAVHKHTKGGDPNSAKVPWKQVSAYIAKYGGSYNFGYATCAKRWDELMAQEDYC